MTTPTTAADPSVGWQSMPSDKCPLCWKDDTFRMPPDWQDRVDRGQSIPITGCGNPWHYDLTADTNGGECFGYVVTTETKATMPGDRP